MPALKVCLGWIGALVAIQGLLSYVSLVSFIKPLEKAALHLKMKKKVDVKLLTSVGLFAR